MDISVWENDNLALTSVVVGVSPPHDNMDIWKNIDSLSQHQCKCNKGM